MAFGFLLERFDIFLIYAAKSSVETVTDLHTRASQWPGLGLLLVGALIIVGACHGRAADPVGVFLVTYVARQIAALGQGFLGAFFALGLASLATISCCRYWMPSSSGKNATTSATDRR